MVRHHVAECPSFLVITRPTGDTQSFGSGYLDVIDVVSIPDRLKHRVAKTEYEYVLNSIFTKVVIDSVDLFLLKNFRNLLVQRLSGLEVSAKRFLNHNPSPTL